MKKVGFIDYYLDEYHANHYPEMLKELSNGELEVAYAFAVKNSPGGATTEEWCLAHEVENIPDIKMLVEKSDCIVVLSPDNPEMHEELCKIPLSSGKCVYVDKTFAPSRKIASKLFEIAEKHGTPCFSASALRFASEFSEVKSKEIENILSYGPGKFENYAVHQIEPIIMLMGTKAKRIISTGSEKHPGFAIEFEDGRRASFSHHSYECPFGMAIDCLDGSGSFITVQSDYFRLFAKEMADFFLTGKIKAEHDETVCIISIIEAAQKALEKLQTWISIPG